MVSTPCQGSTPAPRDSHTSTAVGTYLFILGGTDGVTTLNDLHLLDTCSNSWVTPKVRGESPEAREGHSTALIGTSIFIFGGCGKSKLNSNDVYYNNVYVLNTDTFEWNPVMTLGTPPRARASHTCTSWGSKMVVVGGEDEHGVCLSDIHILDTDNLVWSEMSASGHLFPPLAGHSTISFGGNLLVLGGYTNNKIKLFLADTLSLLDVVTGTWTRISKILVSGDGPEARFSMAVDHDPTITGALVIFGGCGKHLEALGDTYILHTDVDSGRADRHPNVAAELEVEGGSFRRKLKLRCQHWEEYEHILYKSPQPYEPPHQPPKPSATASMLRHQLQSNEPPHNTPQQPSTFPSMQENKVNSEESTSARPRPLSRNEKRKMEADQKKLANKERTREANKKKLNQALVLTLLRR